MTRAGELAAEPLFGEPDSDVRRPVEAATATLGFISAMAFVSESRSSDAADGCACESGGVPSFGELLRDAPSSAGGELLSIGAERTVPSTGGSRALPVVQLGEVPLAAVGAEASTLRSFR